MTSMGDVSPRSRGTKCPSCWKQTALEIIRGRRECRMRVAPEAACAAKSTRVSNQGYTATAGIPCTMVLTVSFVLSPVTMLGCHRHQWNRFHQLCACIGAPGPHDFAVRTNTARRAIIALGDVRPSHPIPNVRDDREPPLLWERDESKEATDLGVRSMRETATDWHDGQIALMRHALLHHTTARHSGATRRPNSGKPEFRRAP